MLDLWREFTLILQLADCRTVCRCLVGVELARHFPIFQAAQLLAQETLGRFGIACGRQVEIDAIAELVDRSIQIGPFTADLDVGLVNPLAAQP